MNYPTEIPTPESIVDFRLYCTLFLKTGKENISGVVTPKKHREILPVPRLLGEEGSTLWLPKLMFFELGQARMEGRHPPCLTPVASSEFHSE